MSGTDGIELGTFAVLATPAEADAFAVATGFDANGSTLPATFPMRWLVSPAIRAALLDLVPEHDLVLVHESQSFDYTQSLHIGGPYDLSLTARREAAPDRLRVDGTVRDADGVACVVLETILRLIAAPPA